MKTKFKERFRGIKPIIRKPTKRKFVAFDCETHVKDNNSFKMGSVYGEDFIKVFWDKEEMGNFLLSKKLDGHIRYATNLDFDFSCLYQEVFKEETEIGDKIFTNDLIRFNKNWDILINGGKVIFCRYKKEGNKTKTFHDTLNLTYNMSVAKMGDILGIHKGKIDFENCSDDELENYNIKDSEISFKFMKWFSNYIYELGGETKVTLASTSLYLFKKKYLKGKYNKPKVTDNILSRFAYYGGRTEVFREGIVENEFYVYDKNSLYPYAMKITNLPDPNYLEYKEIGCYDDIINFEGVTQCKVKVPDNLNIPILPVRTQEKLIFPIGCFYGTWTNNELRYAIENGYEILEIGFSLIAEKTVNELYDFVDDIYRERLTLKELKDNREIILKIILNSLYGKFGINPNKDYSGILKHCDSIPNFINSTGWIQYGETPYFFNNDGFSPSYEIPIWSAYITSTARKLLHQSLTSCSEVYYCDTDSVFTPDILIPSKKLGQLDKELTVIEADIKIPKGYKLILDEIDPKTKMNKIIYKFKGVPHCQNPLHDKPCSCTISKFWDQNFNIELQRFIKIKTGLKMNKLINSTYTIGKSAKLENNKRHFLEDGCSVPLKLVDTRSFTDFVKCFDTEKQSGYNDKLINLIEVEI